MILLLILIAIILFATGYIITPNNADNLLSGYNTLSQEDKNKVDIIAYSKFFKKFHKILAITLFLIGLLFYLLNWSIFLKGHLIIFPLLTYAVFFLKSQFYFEKVSKPWRKIATYFVVIILLGFALKIGCDLWF